MDFTKFDASIDAKKKKIEVIDKKVAELLEQKEKLTKSIELQEKKKTEHFSRELMNALSKKGIPLNNETMLKLLSMAEISDAKEEEVQEEMLSDSPVPIPSAEETTTEVRDDDSDKGFSSSF